MLLALDFYLDTAKEIVIAAPRSLREAEPLLAPLRAAFLPNRVIVLGVSGEPMKALADAVPLAEAKLAIGGKPTAYVRENLTCKLPTSDPAVFARQLADPPRNAR